MITERLRCGKLYRIRREQVAHSRAPYGYRYLRVSSPGGGPWEINPL